MENPAPGARFTSEFQLNIDTMAAKPLCSFSVSLSPGHAMKDIIENLRILNETDVKLQTVQKDLDRMPKELKDKRQVSEDFKTQLDVQKKLILQMKVDSDAMELEMKVGGEALKKFSNQMSLIKTSREMEAIRRQTETQKMFNSKAERKVLELLEEIETIEKTVAQDDEKYEQMCAELAAESTRIDSDMGELNTEKSGLASQREQLAKDIPAKELETYNRIVVNRGFAFAQVKDGYCSACFIQLPPQVHNLALLAKDLISCPSCNRILTAVPV